MKNKVKNRKKTTRKVILLKYKETRNVYILNRAVTKIKENLKIQIQCYTPQPVKEVNRTVTQEKENYPIFRAQMKDRIVPRCLRDKCRRMTNDKSKINDAKVRKIRSPSLITINEEECDGLQYDDISSGSWTDNEIDALMESTRKRMKDSDEEWKLLSRERKSSKKLPKQIKTQCASRSPSLNSLNTLVLEAMEEEVLTKKNLKTVPSETKHGRVERRRYKSKQSLKQKNCFEINEVETFSDVNTGANSQIAKPKKKIELESLETSNSGAQRTHDIYKSNLPKKIFQEKDAQTCTVCQQDKTVFQAVTKQNMIKKEPPETNNNIINQPSYAAREYQNSFRNFKTYNEIDAVIRKLEKSDMDYSSDHTELNLSSIDIKQELYSDL